MKSEYKLFPFYNLTFISLFGYSPTNKLITLFHSSKYALLIQDI